MYIKFAQVNYMDYVPRYLMSSLLKQHIFAHKKMLYKLTHFYTTNNLGENTSILYILKLLVTYYLCLLLQYVYFTFGINYRHFLKHENLLLLY